MKSVAILFGKLPDEPADQLPDVNTSTVSQKKLTAQHDVSTLNRTNFTVNYEAAKTLLATNSH